MAQLLSHDWHKGANATTVAYLGRNHKTRPTTTAFRHVSRLLHGIPTAVGVLLLTLGVLGLGVSVGGYAGFVIFAKAWGP